MKRNEIKGKMIEKMTCMTGRRDALKHLEDRPGSNTHPELFYLRDFFRLL
jgi:hypothetical protein